MNFDHLSDHTKVNIFNKIISYVNYCKTNNRKNTKKSQNFKHNLNKKSAKLHKKIHEKTLKRIQRPNNKLDVFS